MSNENESNGKNMFLFWGCFVALIATAFGFQARFFLVGTWQDLFQLTETQKGEIIGAGLWPFAISIILFSLIIDRVGYGKAMVFAFVCHVTQALMLWFANGYNMLYWGSIIGALGNGTVEAVINPVVATMFVRQKTKWLAILHAGWPGGLVIAGLLFMVVGSTDAAGNFENWRLLAALTLIPVVVYAIMLFKKEFPVNERVKAGVSFKEMLQEPGILGWAVAVTLVVLELGRVLIAPDNDSATLIKIAAIVILVVPYALYVRALGNLMYFFLLLVMTLLATTELGIDGWSRELMESSFKGSELDPAWVLIYTALIMVILRFFAGPITHKLPPLNLLAVSALVAAVGVYSLGAAGGFGMLFIAATIYGVGKTFFWPATLGFVSERFPRGGAMTINMIAGIGMLSVGTIGAPWLGFVQDKNIGEQAQEAQLNVLQAEEKKFVGLISYPAIDDAKQQGLSDEDKTKLTDIQGAAKKNALKTAAALPIIMLICYLILIMRFKSRGGYKPVELDTGESAGGGAESGSGGSESVEAPSDEGGSS